MERKKVFSSFGFVTSPSIEKQNEKIRQMKALSGKDFVVNLIEKIINCQKHNELSLNRNKIVIGFYDLNVENDYDDVAKVHNYLELFKKQGRIEDYSFNNVKYTINKPDIKKLREYLDDFSSIEKASPSRNSSSTTYINGCLVIPGYRKIVFSGCRADILDFFYNSENRKSWHTYEEIKESIGNINTELIRKSISAINKRFAKNSNGDILQLIELEGPSDTSKSAHRYRWKL